MIRRPPRSTRTDTLFPYTTLFRYDPPVRSPSIAALAFYDAESGILYMKGDASDVDWPAAFHALFAPLEQLSHGTDMKQIGRAHVCTPVPNAHLVFRLLLEKKKHYTQPRKINNYIPTRK